MNSSGLALGLASILLSALHAHAQEDAISLDSLVVTASPTPRAIERIANHVSILSGEDLRASGISHVGEALRTVAGLHVIRSGSIGAVTSLFLRGGESDYTLVLVDGMQVNLPGGGFDFASLTTDNLERIEIVRGPGSALYGSDAMAGVVHIITRAGKGPPQLTARLGTASYSEARNELVDGFRWSTDLVGGNERLGYSASLSREETDGILPFNNRHRSTNLSGNARFRADNVTRMAISLRLTDREYQFPTDGAGAVVDQNAFSYGDDKLIHLRATRALTDAFELEGMFGVSGTDGGTDDAQDSSADSVGFYAFKSLDEVQRTKGELRANLTFDLGVLTAGGEIERESQRSLSESMSEFGPSVGENRNGRRNHAAYVHFSGDYVGASLNTGARLEDNERFGTAATWQVGLSKAVPWSKSATAHVLVGRAIKEPTFFESFATGFVRGNPNLKPERAISWEFGLEQGLFAGAATLRATYFDQRFEDLIQYTFAPPKPMGSNYFNVGAATSTGMELGADIDIGLVQASAAWTWLDTEVTDSGFENGSGASFLEGDPLLRRPSNAVTVSASTPVGSSGRVYGRLLVVGSRSDRDFSTFPETRVKLPMYHLMSFGVEWALITRAAKSSGVSVFAQLENLLDQYYEEASGFRAPGRQIHTGISVRFGGGPQ